MSGAMYEALHIFEIILRNAMDQQIGIWNVSQGSGAAWLLNPDRRLEKLLDSRSLSKAQTRARQAALRGGRSVTHDDVLAQMTFGTWRYLLPSHSMIAKQRLWDDAVHKAFPHWYGTWESLVDKVELIHQLRNRVAHLESMHTQDLRAVRRAMRQVSRAVGQRAGRLHRAQDRTLPLIESLTGILEGG